MIKGLVYGGTASCIAEAFTLPVDTVKTRLQLQVGRLQRFEFSLFQFAVSRFVPDCGRSLL